MSWVYPYAFSFDNAPIGLVWLEASTTNGQATVHPTDDGTSSGNALFSEIIGISVTGVRDTTTPIGFALSSAKNLDVNNDKKTISINCAMGKTLLALGDTLQDVQDGTMMYVQVTGKLSSFGVAKARQDMKNLLKNLMEEE